MPWLALGARDPAGFHPLPNLARGLKPMRREHPGASRGVLSPSQTCAVLRTLRLTFQPLPLTELQPPALRVCGAGTHGCRRDAHLVSQQHVGGAMKHALAAHRGDGEHEAARRGTERPLRPPEEVLWAEMVRRPLLASSCSLFS